MIGGQAMTSLVHSGKKFVSRHVQDVCRVIGSCTKAHFHEKRGDQQMVEGVEM